MNERPVPVGLAYQSQDQQEPLAAGQEFRQIYERPLGFLITGNTVRSGQPVEEVDDGVIRLLYWLYLLLC